MIEETLPESLGRYQPIQLLGTGAMGKVYLAVDPLIDRMVAVKVINTELLAPDARAEFIERFRTEVRAAAHRAHPAIVNVHDFADDGPMPYIVMEHVPGQSLAALLRQTPLPDGLAHVVLPVLEGLAAAHAVGVVHRDIKPGNIMITPRGAVKITDFGIARLGDSTLTMVGGMIGTPGYMAPEQAMGRTVDHRADLFATAAVLFEILLGRTPFGGSNVTQTLARLVSPAPAELGPLEGTVIGQVLRRGLAKDVAQRFGSAGEFGAALRRALDEPDDATRIQPAMPGQLPFAEPFTLPAPLAARITEELAGLVGPIARLMLRRAAEGARSTPEVMDRLCATLAPEEAAQLRKRLGALT